LWDEGKFYLYQQELNGELLIKSLSENQIKLYQILKYKLNQTISFSNRLEKFKKSTFHKDFELLFAIQMDIVF